MNANRVKQDHSFFLYVLLSVLTGSIYHFWFMSQWVKEINTICKGDGESTCGLGERFLWDLLTFGIYKYLWYARLADRICDNANRYGLDLPEDGEAVFLWWILLPPVVGRLAAMYLMIRNTNRISAAYNAALRKKTQETAGPKPIPVPKAPVRPPAVQKKGGLLGVAGAYAGCRIPLNPEERVLMGRDAAVVSVVIEGHKLSRKHCMVCYHEDRDDYSVKDYSKNGVFVNGQRIPAGWELHVKPGAVMALANSENSFRLL